MVDVSHPVPDPESVSTSAVLKALLALSRANEKLGTKIAARLRLSRHDVRALIMASDLAPLTASDFAQGLGLPPPTITALIDRLESARLVTRSRDGRDRRKVYVYLTDDGRRVIRIIHEEWRGALCQLDRGCTERLTQDLNLVSNLIERKAHGRGAAL